MKTRICYFCMEQKPIFYDDKTGQMICHDCFGRRYYRRRYDNFEEKPPSFSDLKRHLEKKW